MARVVKGYASGAERVYIPRAYNNHLDADPVTVWIKTPAEHDVRALYCIGEKIRTDKDGATQLEMDASAQLERHKAALERFVVRVANYTAADGKPIATGSELAQHGESGIVYDVSNEILLSLSLTDEQKKSLDGSAGITLAGMSPCGGSVASANDTTLPAGATVAYQAESVER